MQFKRERAHDSDDDRFCAATAGAYGSADNFGDKADECAGVDPKKPLLVFDLPRNAFRVGEVVPINFAIRNAKLRGEGGDFRVRHIIDDDDAQWVDSPQPFGFSGWVPGKHTIRLELIGPDGWPYKNGNHNIITREITVTNQ